MSVGCVSLLVLACAAITSQSPSNRDTGSDDVSHIKFYLWTRKNPNNYEELELTPESVLNSHFDTSHPTIVVAHGFSSEGSSFGEPFAHAYLSVGDFNVVSIEWSKLASWDNYFL